MITAAQYQHQLSELSLDILDMALTSKTEAQEALPKIIAVQNQLQQIEQGINLELHVMRSQYQARIAGAEAGGSSRIMVSAKRRIGSSQRANEEARLTAERDEKVAPFQDLKSKVAELLVKAGGARDAAEKLAG